MGDHTSSLSSSRWCACIAADRVSPRVPSHTRRPPPAGPRPPPTRSASTSASLPRRGSLPPRLASSFVIPTGSPRCKPSPAPRCCASSRPTGSPEIPEDLYYLIKKAVQVRKHLERNRQDKDAKFRLILVEARIHRVSRYYKEACKLPASWKYESATAAALVS